MNRCSQVKSETLSVSWIISTGSSDQNAFKSTTQHTTSVMSKTRSIQGMAHLSWCSHKKMALALILSGTHKYSMLFSLWSTIVAWVKQWKSYGWDGLELCPATNGVLKRLAFQKLDSFWTPLAHSGFLIHHWCSVLVISFQLSPRAIPTLFFPTDLL